MGTFVGAQYACLYPDHIDSLTLLDYHGIQLFNPSIVPIYARMSLESRYDRWRHDQKQLPSRPKFAVLSIKKFYYLYSNLKPTMKDKGSI